MIIISHNGVYFNDFVSALHEANFFSIYQQDQSAAIIKYNFGKFLIRQKILFFFHDCFSTLLKYFHRKKLGERNTLIFKEKWRRDQSAEILKLKFWKFLIDYKMGLFLVIFQP